MWTMNILSINSLEKSESAITSDVLEYSNILFSPFHGILEKKKNNTPKLTPLEPSQK